MDLTVIDDPTVLDGMKDEWERLLDGSECRSVFLTWEWIRNWWMEYAEDRGLFVLCLRDGGTLVALLPLARTEEGTLKFLGHRTLGYLGTGEREEDEVCPSSLQPIVLPEHADAACEAFAEALVERLPGEWDVLRLEAMDGSSSVVRRLEKALSARSGRVRTRVVFQNGLTRLDSGWDAYLRSLGPRTRKKIRRGKTLLESLPGFEYRFLEDEQDVSAMLGEIARMSVMRWGGRSALTSDRFRRFQDGVSRALLKRGRLKLSVMSAEGRVVAANLDYCHKDVVYGYQTAFDPGYRPSIGLGFLGMVYCLENAAREKYRAYDWYRVAPGGYKEHLLNEIKDMISVTVHRSGRAAWGDTIRQSSTALRGGRRLLSGVLGKTRRAYREGGTRAVLSRTWRKLYRRRPAVWYWCDLAQPTPLFDSPVSVTVGREGVLDVIEYMKRKDCLGNEELRVARDNGHWFIGLRQDGVVTGFRKCGFGKVFVNDFGETIELPEGVAFFYESEVDESLRNRGVGKHFMSRSLSLARDSGCRFVVGHVPAWNTPSTRVVQRCGFTRLGAVTFVEFAGIKLGPGKLKRLIRTRLPRPRTATTDYRVEGREGGDPAGDRR